MAVWPTGVATDADLSILKNNLSTTLNGAIDAVTTTVVLTDASNFPTAGYVTIDSEAIKYTGKAGNTLTGVTRGADSTTAASHSNAAPVFHLYVAAHHNGLKDEVIAIESSLNLTASRAVETNGSGRPVASAITATELSRLSGVSANVQTSLDAKAAAATTISAGGVATGGGDLSANRTITVTAATQADQETATSTTTVVVPGRQQYHPSAAKAWAHFNGTTTGTNAPLAGYNVTSITRNASGNYTVNFTTAMSSTNYCVVGSTNGNFFVVGTKATGTVVVRAQNGSFADADVTDVNFVVFGDI